MPKGHWFRLRRRLAGARRRSPHGSRQELIKTFEAPIIDAPPPYTNRFCGRCGSPVPVPSDDASWFEIPAGALDDDPKIRPDKHIYVDFKSSWYSVGDGLPQMTKSQIQAYRRAVV
jgi:hypothetical protein